MFWEDHIINIVGYVLEKHSMGAQDLRKSPHSVCAASIQLNRHFGASFCRQKMVHGVPCQRHSIHTLGETYEKPFFDDFISCFIQLSQTYFGKTWRNPEFP